MKKLKLESLEVTSFETARPDAGERGTVLGRAAKTYLACESNSCPTSPELDCTYHCSMGCPTDFCETQDLGC